MISSTTSKVQYILSSTTETLAVPFYFLENSHLKVIKTVDGVQTVLSIGTHYTVTGAGVSAGGSVILTGTGVAVGNTVTVKRSVPLTQLVDYVYNDRFPAETHEKALDKLTMICQFLQEQAERSLRFEDGEVLDGTLALAARASKILMFDEDGAVDFTSIQDLVELVGDDAVNQANAAAAAAGASAAAAAASETAAGVSEDNAAASAAAALAAVRAFSYDSTGSSGLVAAFIGGTLPSADGSALTVASGTVTLPASTTSIVGFDLYDLTWRALPRAIDTAFIPVARVTTGGSTITSVVGLTPPVLPTSRIARTKARLAQGAPVRVLLVGDSITAGTGGTAGNLWFELCFDAAQVAKGYNVPGAANITLTNLGISASNAYNGLGSIARLLAAPATQRQHPSSAFLPTLTQIARHGLTTRASGPNALVRELPDLVVVALGTNSYGLAKDAELVELTVRGWRALGAEVLIVTTNARTDGPSTQFLDDADAIQAIADTTGSAIADTWAEIAQARLLGITVTPDGVHPNDTGQLLYARAVRRNINTRAQLGESFGPTGLKVFRPSTSTQRVRPPNAAWYQPYQGLGGGAAAAASAISNNYNVVIAGQASGTAVANVPVNGTVNFQCHDATAIVLCYELASGATATINLETVSGTNIKTGVAVGGLSNRTCFLEIASFAELEAISGAIQASGQRTHAIPVGGFLKVTAITGGPTTLGVQGFLYPSHNNVPLDWTDFQFTGTWVYEAARDDASIQIPYTDTANDEFVVCFEGDALQLTLQTGSVSGSGTTISAWIDGEQILTNAANDPFGGGSAGGFVNNVVLMPNNTGAASGKNFGGRRSVRHTARVRLTALGSTGPSAGNRNLALIAARVLNFE